MTAGWLYSLPGGSKKIGNGGSKKIGNGGSRSAPATRNNSGVSRTAYFVARVAISERISWRLPSSSSSSQKTRTRALPSASISRPRRAELAARQRHQPIPNYRTNRRQARCLRRVRPLKSYAA
jgi:hypothetical protein